MGNLEAWVVRNKMEINAKKTKEMWISFRKSQELQAPEPIRIRKSEIERVKLLGVHVQSNLKLIAHIDEIVARASKRLYFLRFAARQACLPKLDVHFWSTPRPSGVISQTI